MRSLQPVLASVLLVFSLVACGGDDDDGGDDSSGLDGSGQDSAGNDSTPQDSSEEVTCFSGDASCDYFAGPDASGSCPMGQKCAPIGAAPTCSNFTGTKTAYETCTNDDECEAGTMCSNHGAGKACLPLCSTGECTPEVACPDGSTCFSRVTAVGTSTQIAELCTNTCSLLDQDCTANGLSCYTSTDLDVMEMGICAGTGTKADGESCVFSNDCVEGSTCIRPMGATTSSCFKFCARPPAANTCGTGETCTLLTGHTDTGFCKGP